MSIYFNCFIKLDSVKLAYIDKLGDKKTADLISEDRIHWEVKEEDKLGISYYSFIVNEQFWVCDTNNSEVIKINNGFFSKYYSLISNTHAKLSKVNSLFCSEFLQDSLEPIKPKSVFNNLDDAICFWAEISGVSNDSLIIFQIIDPKGNLYFMDHELLRQNNHSGIRNYYAVLKTSSKLIRGEWTFMLIYKKEILSSKKVTYNILNNSYKTNDTHFTNDTTFRVDIRM
ncbi:hypothetical protein SAMN04487786_1069 [Paenisporosarcina quisquiliarum]|nr:hypothetical protein SAMN04487786_1069 [Paenisporosarcina quisquiliarum]